MARPRRPTREKAEAGTLRRDRLPAPVPLLPGGSADPPELAGPALEKWRELAPLVESAGGLTLVNRERLLMTCRAYGEYREADEALRTKGDRARLTYGTRRTGMQRPLPQVAIRDAAWKRYMAGMTSLERALEGAPPSDQPSEFEVLLGGRDRAAR
jgi:phage terminase small subunit